MQMKIFNNVLAIIFIVIIFYIGSATFPQTLINIGNFLNDENIGITLTRDRIDSEYRNMLDFESDYLINKGTYINLNGLIARILGQRSMNERVRLDNGHLTSITSEPDIATAAPQIIKLYDKQIENGKNFLFILAPSQVPKYEDILPAGYEDYANQNSDKLLDELRESNVPVLDLREEMMDDGIDHQEAFFVTDHHWKPETGFWAYSKIIDYFIQSGIIEPIDPKYTDIDEFEIDVYKDWYLGSSGKRTGIYFAGVDDFSVIKPKFETDISIKIPSVSVDKRGDFADVSYNGEMNRKNYFSANPYVGYGHGDAAHKLYRNEAAPVDLKILSIGDSFKNVPATFLPLVISTCDELDMRYFKGDFHEYYSEFNPDIVIMLINAASPVQANTTYDYK